MIVVSWLVRGDTKTIEARVEMKVKRRGKKKGTREDHKKRIERKAIREERAEVFRTRSDRVFFPSFSTLGEK